MREHPVTRRRALQLALAATAAGASLPAVAAAAPEPAAEGAADASFTSTYAAWPGHATTMRGSIVPGAVPVSAPASGDEAWSLTARAGEAASPLALRQMGQTTYAYALIGQDLVKIDAASGSEGGDVELPGPAAASARAAFVDATLVVTLADGRLAAIDEDLVPVWTSDAPGLDLVGVGLLPSAPLEAGGRVLAAVAGDDGAERRIVLRSLAPFDGRTLSSTSIMAPSSEAAGAPQLIRMGDAAALFSDGVHAAYLLDPTAARPFKGMPSAVLSRGSRGCLRLAETPFEAGDRSSVVGVSSDGRASELVRFSTVSADGPGPSGSAAPEPPRLEASSLLDLSAGVPACDPVVFAGRVLAVLRDPSADGGCRAVLIALPDGEGAEAAVLDELDLPGLKAALAPVPLAAASGERPSEASVEILIADAAGAVASLELPAPAAQAAGMTAHMLREASGDVLDAASSPLATREGTLLLATPEAGSAQITAIAPDAARTAATPSGGSTGLDTVGGVLSGASLPTGAGLGVGALVLAAAFGAYAWIRNRGGRARRDEGVDEWRSRTRGDERDGSDPGSDGRRP